MKPGSVAQPNFWIASRRGSCETIVVWPLPFAMAVRPAIFLPRDAGGWDDLSRQAILAHERVHHRQQRALGLARFALAYYLSRRLRWRIEKAGYRRQFAVYVRHGRGVDPAGFARMLSGPFYCWMVGYAEARAWCDHAMRKRSGSGE